MAALEIITALSILLLVGVILTYLCGKLKISNVFFLIVAGFLMSFIKLQGQSLVVFSTEFLTSVAIIALIMIVFDSTSRFRVREIAKETSFALEVSLLFMVVSLVVIPIVTHFLFGFAWWISILFASMMLGTDPSAVVSVLKDIKHHSITFLEWESVINTPLTVIIPFMVIEMSKTFSWGTIVGSFLEQIIPFLQQIVTGIGAGIVVFLLIFKILKGKYLEVLTPVTLLVSALLTYVLAEGLKGNGILAVTALGILFGNVYFQKKETLQTFGQVLSTLFEILVFLLLGLSIKLPGSWVFYVKALILFVVYLALRGGVIFLIFKNAKDRTIKEKVFMTLNSSKGVAVAVVVFFLISLGIGREVIDLGVLFILYSLIVSTIMGKSSKFFLHVEAKGLK